MTLAIWKSYGKITYFVIWKPNCYFLIRLRLCFLGRKTRKVKAIFTALYQEFMPSIWVVSVNVNPDHLAEVVFIGSSTVMLCFLCIYFLYRQSWNFKNQDHCISSFSICVTSISVLGFIALSKILAQFWSRMVRDDILCLVSSLRGFSFSHH